jgi:hypothetical protein
MSPVPKHVSVPLRPVLRPMAGTGHKLCISCPKDKGAFRMWPQDAMKSAKYCDERLNSFAETSRNALRRSRSGRPSVFDEVTKGPGFGLARGVSVERRPDLNTFEARPAVPELRCSRFWELEGIHLKYMSRVLDATMPSPVWGGEGIVFFNGPGRMDPPLSGASGTPTVYPVFPRDVGSDWLGRGANEVPAPQPDRPGPDGPVTPGRSR